MTRFAALATTALLLLAQAPAAAAQGGQDSPALPMIKQAFAITEGRFVLAFDRYCGTDPTLPVALGKGAAATPSKLFDNLYYVGRTDVGAWVVKTSDGLVLIDTLYSVDDVEKIIVPGMKALGLDPGRIKLIILTHFHGDHAGGMPYFKARGVKVMVSEKDWGPLGGVPSPDVVLHDQQVVQVGDTPFTTLLTPGHTPGTISIVFPVREGAARHVAIVMGGLGPRGGLTEYRGEVEGIERMRAFAKTAGVDVPLDPHEVIVDSAAFEQIMHGRRSGQANELVLTPARYQTFHDMVATCHRSRIATMEQKAAQPAAK